MATRRRKTRRLRGSRTHGWGRSGQHRNSGSQGGHGRAGLRRHKKSMVIRYGIQMGEKGFRPANPHTDHTINISQLTEQLDNLTEDGHVRHENGTTTIDLEKAGYDKLLGDGTINKPLHIIIGKASEKASEKIAQAGGQILQPGTSKSTTPPQEA